MLARLAAVVLLFTFVAACSADPKPGITPSSSVPTPTEEPTKLPPRPETTFVPGPSATPAATPTAAPTVVAPGTQTGIPSVDAVIRAVLNGDAAALAALMPLREVGCTNASGAGGPPKCPQVGSSYAPEGTIVRAFPVLHCEGFWVEETRTMVTELVRGNPELYGVIQLRFATPLFDEPYMPKPDYGIILSVANPAGAPIDRRGIMLMMERGVVALVHHICTGPPEALLQKQPQPYLTFGDQALLILRGPAYRDP